MKKAPLRDPHLHALDQVNLGHWLSFDADMSGVEPAR